MGLLLRMQEIVQETANLLIGFNNRLNVALTEINANPPTYDADDLTRDITQTGLDTLRLWLRFGRPLGDPTLPTLVITTPQGGVGGTGTAEGDVSLVEMIPLGVAPGATRLLFAGDPAVAVPPNPDATTIASLAPSVGFPVLLDPLRQRLRLRIAVPAAQPRGVYHGLILLDAAAVAAPPIAAVVARVI